MVKASAADVEAGSSAAAIAQQQQAIGVVRVVVVASHPPERSIHFTGLGIKFRFRGAHPDRHGSAKPFCVRRTCDGTGCAALPLAAEPESTDHRRVFG